MIALLLLLQNIRGIHGEIKNDFQHEGRTLYFEEVCLIRFCKKNWLNFICDFLKN